MYTSSISKTRSQTRGPKILSPPRRTATAEVTTEQSWECGPLSTDLLTVVSPFFHRKRFKNKKFKVLSLKTSIKNLQKIEIIF